MINPLTRLLTVSLLAVLISACSTVQAPQTQTITLLHTNDHHGRFWRNARGEYGMAARYTLIQSIRQQVAKEGGVTLLLSGGDINTGVPESDMQAAKPDFIGMKALGYDAMALGNHEFDNPIGQLKQQRQWAGFPFLSANTLITATDEPLFKPYTIVNKGGLTIAIIGLTTTDTARIAHPDSVAGLTFEEPLEVMPSLIRHIDSAYAPDMTLALTHMGHFANGQHGSNAPGDVALARGLSAHALDAIIGGHSQNPVCMTPTGERQTPFKPDMACMPDRHNGTWIMQAYEWGKYVGRADFERIDDQWKLVNYELIPVNLSESARHYPEDSDMLTLLRPYQKKGRQALGQVIGHSHHTFSGARDLVRRQPAALGRLITRAQQQAVNADLAVISSGGIRASLPAGPVTYKDVLKIHPFGNTIAYVDLNGAALRDYIRSVHAMSTNSGAYPQWNSIQMIPRGDAQTRLIIGGKPLQDDTVYRLAVNSFNARGGDGYPRLDTHPAYVDTGWVDAEVLKDYIAAHSPLTRPQD